ncbi:hypothetical protein J6590_062168 [Homalodisca vitripennis]|nr:hypothetical protein J6590_062168 [Homalodisca vitripennis]
MGCPAENVPINQESGIIKCTITFVTMITEVGELLHTLHHSTVGVSVIRALRAEVSAPQDIAYCRLDRVCVTIMDQRSTSSTNRSELVCRKYYLRLGLIGVSVIRALRAEVSAPQDIAYCRLDRVCVTIMDQRSTSSTNRSEVVCRSVLSGMLRVYVSTDTRLFTF